MVTVHQLLLIEALLILNSLLLAHHGTQLLSGTKGCLELEESTARLFCFLRFAAPLAVNALLKGQAAGK